MMFRLAVFVVFSLLDRAAAAKGLQLIKASPADIAELQKQSAKDLVSSLSNKGVECSQCSTQKQYMDLVVETWGWGPYSVKHPEGPAANKTEFMKQLRALHADPNADSVHEVEGDTLIQSEDDLQLYGEQWEAVWADFSRKMADGTLEVKDGKPSYDFASAFGNTNSLEINPQDNLMRFVIFGFLYLFVGKHVWNKYRESKEVCLKFEEGEECLVKLNTKPEPIWIKAKIEAVCQEKDHYDIHILKTDEPQAEEMSDTHHKNRSSKHFQKVSSGDGAGDAERKEETKKDQ